MTHTNQFIELLNSGDWSHVNQSFELYGALKSPEVGKALIQSLLPEDSGIADGPWDLELYVSMWEDDVESCTFTAGEETWVGGVQHGGKAGITFGFSSADKAALAVATACIKADHWNSCGVSDDLPWEYPDGVVGKGSECFYKGPDGAIIDGEPEPADEYESVERENLDGVGAVYHARYGFGDGRGCQLKVTDAAANEVDIDDGNIRAMLLALALHSGVDMNALPTIDTEAAVAELDWNRQACFGD